MRHTIMTSCLLLMLLLGSCKSQKLTYFENLGTEIDGTLNAPVADIRIRPGDELQINVTAPVPEAVAPYTSTTSTSAAPGVIDSREIATKELTYRVDTNGDIVFPVLGKVHAGGLTTAELADNLTRRIAEDVESPIVRVTLANFRIKVLGEVRNPGAYDMDRERVSVLDAVAMAGDLTMYGRRDNVVVIREEDGKVNYHKLNLNDARTLSSPYFYLQQNDVVYVDPSESRKGQAAYNQNNSYKISVISAVVSAVSVIASLIIALTK